jgi:DNA polymerase
MNQKQIRMLELLDIQIQSCEKCELCLGGRAKPHWSNESKYVIVGEAPGSEEAQRNTPFVGPAGAILWEKMSENGYSRDDFLIINSVNCRPVSGKRNDKPSDMQMETCYPWLIKYIRVLQPAKLLILGGYALNTMLKMPIIGIMKHNAITYSFGTTPCVVSVHPAFALRNASGVELLSESIKKFKEIG